MSDDTNARRLWPFAELYEHVLREGHQKQAPACGSPTLIWHMALWPHDAFGERERKNRGAIDTRARATELFLEYDEDNIAFFEELDAFALELQKLGRVGEPKSLTWRKAEIEIPDGVKDQTHRFLVCDPQSLSFTLWWQDSAKGGQLNQRQTTPLPTDLRVRAQIQTHRDHATVAFYIDVAKLYDETQLTTSRDAYNVGGERRPRILHGVDKVRETSAKQIRGGYVEMSRIPEQGVEPTDAQALLDAANYCYDGIWREFAESFGLEGMFDKRTETYPHMRVSDRFADFRGLVMSVRGMETPELTARRNLRDQLRNTNAQGMAQTVKDHIAQETQSDAFTPSPIDGTIGLGHLSEFSKESNEGNTVLKSLWPFMRRITPWADFSDWVGCGIINGRALYITALGSEAMVGAANEESAGRASDVPSGYLPAAETNPPEHPRALRYLVVTKGEPLREQVGRFVERVNALGTMRLFALRNMGDIRNASVHIEVIGRMLDSTLRTWEKRRRKIDSWYADKLKAHKRKKNFHILRGGRLFSMVEAEIDPKRLEIERKHTDQMSDLIRDTEREVIAAAGLLDDVGAGGYGRLLYAIRRAQYFSGEFERMWKTLGIEDIEGWINYRNFVQRGMQPAFAFIETTGVRLISIRDRLQTITETIQTAALIVETGATRENTARLKEMGAAFTFARGAAYVGILIWLYQLLLHDYVKPRLENVLNPMLDTVCVGLLGEEKCADTEAAQTPAPAPTPQAPASPPPPPPETGTARP